MRMSWMTALVASAAVTAIAPSAFASSHSEAPGTAADPEIDNTDVWAWRHGQNLVVVMGYNGLQVPYAAPNWKKFSDDALYELHIARGGTSLEDELTYQFRFHTTPYPRHEPEDLAAVPNAGGNEFFAQISGGGAFAQTYSVTKIVAGQAPVVLVNNAKTAPPNVGPRTNQFAYATGGASYESFFTTGAQSRIISLGNGEGRVFAGPRDDPFYVDLGSVFDLAGLRPVLGPTAGLARDSVRYTNVQTIAIEIPLTVANGGAITADGTPSTDQTVGVWASASRRKTTILRRDGTNDTSGPWVQVSRFGLPLINEAVIGLQDKDYWNRLRPADDLTYFSGYFLNPMVVRDAEFAGFYGAGGPLNGCIALNGGDLNNLKTGRQDIIDVINIKDFPSANAHAITSIGDVQRVDLAIDEGGFPNGRSLTTATGYEPDVTDTLLKLLLCGAPSFAVPAVVVPDGVNVAGDVANKATFPYANAPHDGFKANVAGAPDP